MNFLELAKHRCTTRGFTEQRISENDLEQILSAGCVAPTACNKRLKGSLWLYGEKYEEKQQKLF